MELLATAAAIAALTLPGWLFRRVPLVVGTLATLVLFFCTGFFGSLNDGDAMGRAVGWGVVFGTVGGIGFFGARWLQDWEAQHPVDVANLSRTQVWTRRIALPVAVGLFVMTVGGIVILPLELLSLALWVTIVGVLMLACLLLYVVFLRSGTSAN